MSFFKYCPQCGSQNNEFIHQRRFECFDCGMVYFHNVATAVAVIIEREKKILFTIRSKEPGKNMLDLPGGFTDPDETAEETCSRELKEELNIHISPSNFKFFKSHPNDYTFKNIPYKTEDMIYTAILPEDAKFQLEKEEIKDIKWISKTEIPLDKIAFKSIRKTITEYLAL
ncbi:MAG: NUDIX domain-containing protein [Chitinophagales bacterium]|nr:NUDIX domain-containing protein [Chitinophagales bacterium]